MMSKARRGFPFILSSALMLAGGIGVAEDTTPAQATATGGEDVQPGLHVYGNTSSGSLLRQAQRDRKSLVIGTEAASDEEPLVQQASDIYVVREGDTLWGICERFVTDPYQWPRVWSYNPGISNPNWIYPGDVVRLAPSGPEAAVMTTATAATKGPMLLPGAPSAAAQASSKGILIRNRGFIDRKGLERSGVLVGSNKERELLAQHDEAYVEFENNSEVREGDEYAAFRVLGEIDGITDEGSDLGQLVEIVGLVRVLRFDKDKGIARIVVDESLQPIERGTMIGPVHRRFDLVAPTTNQKSLSGHVVAFLDPIQIAGTHQVAFVDLGTADGVVEGNRFFVVKRRDQWRESRDEDDDRDGYPQEVLAELRVIEARPHTSTCLVTASVRELEVGATVEMRQGY